VSLDAFGDNVWVYAAVIKMAQEIARTKFRLRRQTKKGRVEYVDKHEALATLIWLQSDTAARSRGLGV